MNHIFQKLKNRKGVTLVEMLVCVVVLILITQVILLTVQMSVKYYKKSIRESEAQILCGSLANAIKDELEYATSIRGSGTATEGVYTDYTYYSRARSFGAGCKLALYPETDTSNANHVAVQKGSGAAAKYYGLVGSKTYTFGLQVVQEGDDAFSVTWDSVNKCFNVHLAIQTSADDSTVLATESFTVYPVNAGK